MSDESSSFLSRWSRRKTAARAGEVLEEPASNQASEIEPADTGPPPELPSIESLQGLQSDYQDFMDARVHDDTKRAALKQLFNDPHFNKMDGLDVYIDDYGKPDPIPPAMLAALNHARGLLWDSTADSEPSKPDEITASPEQNSVQTETDTSTASLASPGLECEEHRESLD